MEINYYNKYLKYKSKYIKLLQSGSALSKNKIKKFKNIFPEKILKDKNIYLVHLSENLEIFKYNKKNIIHFLHKKIEEIDYVINSINLTNNLNLLEKIDIMYKDFSDKQLSQKDISLIINSLIKKKR